MICKINTEKEDMGKTKKDARSKSSVHVICKASTRGLYQQDFSATCSIILLKYANLSLTGILFH